MPTANEVSSGYAATHVVSDWLVSALPRARGYNGCHPSSEPKQACDPQDQHRYQSRGLVENACWRLKTFRRIATLYEDEAASFLSGVALAIVTALWL